MEGCTECSIVNDRALQLNCIFVIPAEVFLSGQLASNAMGINQSIVKSVWDLAQIHQSIDPLKVARDQEQS